MYKKYLTHNWLTENINVKCVKETLSFMKGNLLDIGCGDKPYFNIIKSNVKTYIGIDHPTTYRKNKKFIDVFGDACNLPFINNVFDSVVSFQVMEHVPEPDKMVSEIYRVLKKNGHIVLTTPFMWGIHDAPYDFYRYTKYGLKYLFEKYGFKIIELKATTGYWVMAGLRFNYYLVRFGKGCLKWILSLIFFIISILSIVFDKVDKVESDTASYTLVAMKK